MAEYKIAAVFRSRDYSPNHIGNDAAILNSVSEQLRRRGCRLSHFTEEDLMVDGTDLESYNAWITMSRSAACVDILAEIERTGVPVVNSPESIINCRRGRMARLLQGHRIACSPFIETPTDAKIEEQLKKDNFGRCWIKQADFHSKHKEDVTFVRHAGEAQEVLHEYFMRGITRALICKHLEGEIIRFYGVRGTNFFQWFFPTAHHDEEKKQLFDRHYPVDEGELFDLCDRAAEVLELVVYGGDCVRMEDGTIVLIDINDWPSFAPCRKEAASAIAKYVMKLLR